MDTLKQLQRIFRFVFDDDTLEINIETKASDIEEWDSLSHMQLIVEIEKEFDIKFTTNEIKSAKNVGEFIEFIERKKVRNN